MFIDTEELEDRAPIDGQVVIVGGGMAGITLARQLADAGLDIVMLESGGEKPDDRTQALYAGTMTWEIA
jgi:flavin-dependent dehydrogenase